MEYKLQDIENMYKKMNELLALYEHKYEATEYTLNLATGDNLKINIPKSSIAHLLGVSIDEIRMSGIVKGNADSYTILKTFLDNGAYQLYSNKELLSKVFSKDIDKKLKCFDTNVCLRMDDICCIIKYDSERTYQAEENPDICDYFIVRRNNNMYYVLGLIKNADVYVPVTSRLYSEFTDFNKFMFRIGKNQEFTFAARYSVENEKNGFSISPFSLKMSDKKDILRSTMSMARQYDGITSVAYDYVGFMNRTSNNYHRNNNERDVLRVLQSSIYGNEVLSAEAIQDIIGEGAILSDEIRDLIDAWNDYIVSSGSSGIAVNSFSAMESKFLDYKEKNEILTTELASAQERIALLEVEKAALIAERDSSNAKVKVLTDAFETVKTM